jgi:hypothetical protein
LVSTGLGAIGGAGVAAYYLQPLLLAGPGGQAAFVFGVVVGGIAGGVYGYSFGSGLGNSSGDFVAGALSGTFAGIAGGLVGVEAGLMAWWTIGAAGYSFRILQAPNCFVAGTKVLMASERARPEASAPVPFFESSADEIEREGNTPESTERLIGVLCIIIGIGGFYIVQGRTRKVRHSGRKSPLVFGANRSLPDTL